MIHLIGTIAGQIGKWAPIAAMLVLLPTPFAMWYDDHLPRFLQGPVDMWLRFLKKYHMLSAVLWVVVVIYIILNPRSPYVIGFLSATPALLLASMSHKLATRWAVASRQKMQMSASGENETFDSGDFPGNWEQEERSR